MFRRVDGQSELSILALKAQEDRLWSWHNSCAIFRGGRGRTTGFDESFSALTAKHVKLCCGVTSWSGFLQIEIEALGTGIRVNLPPLSRPHLIRLLLPAIAGTKKNAALTSNLARCFRPFCIVLHISRCAICWTSLISHDTQNCLLIASYRKLYCPSAMVDWVSLAIPFLYLTVLVGSLATFSSLYRKRKAGS